MDADHDEDYLTVADFRDFEISLIYYAFTSLTTVGFGDFYPRSNGERLIIGFCLLFGVNIFSIAAGSFLDILTHYKELHEEYEESEQLSRFISTLKEFNLEQNIDMAFKEKLLKYFHYRWEHFKYHVFLGGDENLTIQIPHHVLDRLMSRMIYKPFIRHYKHIL